MPPRVGQVVNNKYRLLRHIGDGGMGSVFEARHETLGTTVALKFLHLEFSRREGLVQRFVQEARASAQIQSANVVRVSDVDQTGDGDVFIVLEYLEGKTLQALYEELYRGGKKLAYSDALDYASQILDGVDAAHRAGIVHRDLKPDNVMITIDAKGATIVKLLDFGIAKLKVIGNGAPGLTRPGVLMGTPEYMAPEQTSSADTVDARADVFSLGVMIFEMLAGQRPVGGEDPHEIAAAYRNGRISQLVDLVPGIAPELAAAVHRAMAARPDDRMPTAADLRAAIEPYAAAVRPPSPSRVRAGGTIGVSIGASPSPIYSPLPSPVLAPVPPAPRAGGVAKTWPPEDDAPPAGAGRVSGTMDDGIGSAPMRASGTIVGANGGGNGGSTQDMAHGYGYPPAPPVALPPLPMAPAGGRRRKRGNPTGAIIAGALALAGLVTGGVYVATRSSSSDDDTPTKPSNDPPPLVSVGSQQPPSPPVPPTDPPPPIPSAPLPMPPNRPNRPTGPAPRPSGSAVPSSTAPSPILVLPTSFPFPNPFQPAPQPPGSGAPKQKDPPLFPPI
ncbi:Serine/threonine-protein kinase pksC [Minicystis rosea]|nr:Serine/threonine-protein kinase pksC [Minicystis rosea]